MIGRSLVADFLRSFPKIDIPSSPGSIISNNTSSGFSPSLKAVLRRSRRDDKKDEIIVGDLKIYPNKHKVKSCGNEVTLTNKEFKLLCLLVESKGNVLNRDQLLTNIWGYDFDGETRTVDVHIRSLRQKLGECGKLIETVRGIGYRIGGSE